MSNDDQLPTLQNAVTYSRVRLTSPRGVATEKPLIFPALLQEPQYLMAESYKYFGVYCL